MKSIDYFGTNLNFYFNKSTNYKSPSGSFFTIMTMLISMGIFIYFGTDLIAKEKPFSYQNVEILKMPEVDIADLLFAVQVTDMSFNPVKDVLTKFNYIVQITDANSSPPRSQNLEMVPCNQTSFFRKNTSGVLSSWKFKTGNYFCIPENLNFTIKGDYQSGQFSFTTVSVRRCNSSRYNCVSDDALQKEFPGTFMVDIFHLDYYVQVGNYDAPLQKAMKEIAQPTTLTQQIIKLLSLDSLQVSTDNGILTDNINSVYSYQRESLIEYSLYNQKPSVYALIQVVMSGKKQQYIRNYIKIQTVLANTFTIINIINLVISYFNGFLAKYQLTYDIYNELYKCVKSEESDDQNEDRKDSSVKNTEQFKTESNLQGNLKKNLPQFFPKLNFFQTLLLKIPYVESYKEINSAYDQMRDLIETSLDYINVIKLYLTLNKINNDYLPVVKNDIESSKSMRSNVIMFKSKNSLKHKTSSNQNKITL